MDRNEKARREFEMQQERRRVMNEFSQAVSAGKVALLDRLGRPIETGAMVMYRLPVDLLCEVVDVTPLLDPQSPPGAMRIVLRVADIPLTVMANRRNVELVIVAQPQDQPAGTPTDVAEAPAEEDVPLPFGPTVAVQE